MSNIHGDDINTLPVDKDMPNSSEIHILNTLFKKEQNALKKIFTELKDIFLLGCLYILVSLFTVDEIIKKFVLPAQKSIYILYGIKALILMFLFFIIKNMYLVRKHD